MTARSCESRSPSSLTSARSPAAFRSRADSAAHRPRAVVKRSRQPIRIRAWPIHSARGLVSLRRPGKSVAGWNENSAIKGFAVLRGLLLLHKSFHSQETGNKSQGPVVVPPSYTTHYGPDTAAKTCSGVSTKVLRYSALHPKIEGRSRKIALFNHGEN